MRRLPRLGLAALILAFVLAGGFTAYWLIAASRVKDGVVAWAQSEHARDIDVSWRAIRVSGFPFAFRLGLDQAVVRDRAITPAPELRIPALSGRAALWDFTAWQLAAPQGLAAEIPGAAGRPAVRLSARSATGMLRVEPAGGAKIRLRAREVTADAGAHLAIGLADSRILLPARPPRSHTDPLLALTFRLQQLRLPKAIGPFGKTIADLSFGVTIDGVLPRGPLIHAVTAWRNSGGTIELDHLHLHWGALAATASGTLALDRNLQPVGGFSGAIEGYNEILTALVRTGRMRAKDAGLARLALTMLAKAGPDGRPQIATSFTIQNGEMYLGPARLGPAPRLAWE